MPRVKNISGQIVMILDERKRGQPITHITIQPGCFAQIPLGHQLKHLVREGYLSLADGGEIVDIPGGMRHKKALPPPPLRSVDDPWMS